MLTSNLIKRIQCVVRGIANLTSTTATLATYSMTSPVVTVQEGKLRGVDLKLLDDSTHYSFKGIPYAQPPVGELRFKAPLAPKPWAGVLETIEHGPICPQLDLTSMSILEGNENCLYLNVYTKSLQADSKLPVMVYMHGGGFMSGSGDSDMYGPEFLIQHDVILVTINYRLEVLGFLCLDTPEVPGNAGMKDQVAALRWVQKNIKQFGGDPDNVTIFGESAGGASVTYHMLSPMSRGLFHKVISQSGVCLHDWAYAKGSREMAFRAGKVLGKEIKDPDELVNFLQSQLASKLTAFSTSMPLTTDEQHRGVRIFFTPVVEKVHDGAFLSEEPIGIILSGKAADVPIIAGYNSEEGLLLAKKQLKKIEIMNENPSLYVPNEIARKVSKEKLLELGQRIKDFYVGGKDITSKELAKMSAILTDVHFSYNVNRFANMYVSKYNQLYLYRFNCDSDLNVIKNLSGLQKIKGTIHADDIFYMFYNGINKDFYEDKEETRQIVYNITKMWTDFAKTGNPTPNNSLGVKWSPHTPSGKECLNIESELSLGSHPDGERMDFWNKIYTDAGLPHIS